ncbi:MAG: hypothetical protein JWM80_640 [Cyanobacteria bacterium RYN_339]|nr:hypothetical protein [Cyanobacteria bacterium RYN_339]
MGSKAKALSAEMGQHLTDLGFEAFHEYEAWCARLGRSPARRKSPRERDGDLLARREERVALALKQSRRADRETDLFLERAVAGCLPADAPPRFAPVADAARSLPQPARRAFLGLLQAWDWPLDTDPAVPELGEQVANTYVAALARLAAYHQVWVRPPATWRCTCSNPVSVFSSLARHLLAKFPLPAFFDTAWFGPERYQAWYAQLGRGESTKALAEVPLPYTRRMFHCFLEAPEGFTVAGALRRGQVLGLGGDLGLVCGLLGSRLADVGPHEAFWATVVQWLVANPAFPGRRAAVLIDFVHAQRFEGPPIWVDRGRQGHAPPPRPDFSLKGRTVASMQRLIAAWHRELGRSTRDIHASWPACRISGMWLEREGARWEVQELTSSEALREEGSAMHHCVASYVQQCTAGHAAIFSVRQAKRKVTVEVRLANKHLVQVRGPYNQVPDGDTWAVVEAWARREGLAIPTYVRP